MKKHDPVETLLDIALLAAGLLMGYLIFGL